MDLKVYDEFVRGMCVVDPQSRTRFNRYGRIRDRAAKKIGLQSLFWDGFYNTYCYRILSKKRAKAICAKRGSLGLPWEALVEVCREIMEERYGWI